LWRISSVDHVGGEVSGIQRSKFQEVRNLSAVDLASHEILKSERKNSWKHWRTIAVGPIEFQGSGSQETELHVNATPEITKREKPKAGSQIPVGGYVWRKLKEVVEFRWKSQKTIDLAKKGKISETGKS
jgi:hypothetical protein